MGILQNNAGRRVTLDAVTTIGRGLTASICLLSRATSGLHAELRWQARGWSVKDLGSTNGTWVRGMPLLTPGYRLLMQGDTLTFGTDDETWTLVDATPPNAEARNGAVTRRGNPLGLPDDAHPLVVISATDGERWCKLDLRTDEHSPVVDGAEVQIDGQTWALTLPVLPTQTLNFDQHPPVCRLKLVFELSGPDEPTALVIHRPYDQLRRPARAHHRLLYWLACRRKNDEAEQRAEQMAAGDSTELLPFEVASDLGWTEASVLWELLGCDRVNFNVYVFRARQEFATMGVPDFANIVERRPTGVRGVYLYRLGTSRITLQQIG
jgi:pSer/pThr/pTyr-binding forkhead associated (FHA) protein